MNLIVKNIVDCVEQFAPPSLAESYDNTGLLIGKRESVVTKLLLCVDVTQDVVDEAIKIGADMILSHHPLIFSGLKSLTGANELERSVIKLIKNDISLYCCHTSIDATVGGVSYAMGEMLSLKNVETLAPISTQSSEGFGVVGDLENSMELLDFLKVVKECFGVETIRYSRANNSKIKRVAMCGGSGASLIKDAIGSNADIYIAADFKYHDFCDAYNSIIIADIGHFESEKVVIDIFYKVISKKYHNFAVCKSSLGQNPVYYF